MAIPRRGSRSNCAFITFHVADREPGGRHAPGYDNKGRELELGLVGEEAAESLGPPPAVP